MLGYDLIDVFAVNIGVPDVLRIDYDHRPGLASTQATGGIHSDATLAAQPQLFDFRLGVIAYFGGIALPAAHFAGLALIGTEKHMILIMRHC